MLLPILIISSVAGFGQQVLTTELVKINLPTGLYKLNEKQVNSLPVLKGSEGAISLRAPYIYKIDNILLSFFNVNSDRNNTDLVRQKRFMDYLNSGKYPPKDYNSIIKKVNNKEVLIVNYTINGMGKYRFFASNELSNLMLSGKMEFPKTEAKKAEEVLNDVLANIQFAR